jgi:glycosyltransferase involved in cell wall biosynthesis
MRTKRAPGFVFVLPWELQEIGGVNAVIINLWREMERHGRFRPLLMVNSWEHRTPALRVAGGREDIHWRLRAPCVRGAAVKSMLSFLATLPKALLRARCIVKRHNVAAINVHYPGLSALTFVILRWLRLYRGHLLLSFHNSDIWDAAKSKGLERVLWHVLLRSVTCVTVSESLAKQVTGLCRGCRVTTIHNGIDLAEFRVQRDKGYALEPRLLQHPYVLNVAAFLPQKGQDVLIRAFASVAKRFPDVRLALVGQPGPFLAEIQDQVQQQGLADKVLVFENIAHDKVAAFLERAALFVLASRREGLPIVLLEAAAFALPVVATAVDGVPELVVHGRNGRLVPADDADTLEREMSRLLADPDEARRLGQEHHCIVTEQFGWPAAYEKYARLVRSREGAVD